MPKLWGLFGIIIGVTILLSSIYYYLNESYVLLELFIYVSIGLIVIISGLRMYRYKEEDAISEDRGVKKK